MTRAFGNNKPQFQGTGTPDSTVRDLDYVKIVSPKYTLNDTVEQKSPRATGGDRDFQTFGFYSEFTYIVLLDKYASAETQYTLLETYRYQDVYFAPHRDKGFLQKATGGNALFTVVDVQPTLLDEYSDINAATITFKSKNYMTLQ